MRDNELKLSPSGRGLECDNTNKLLGMVDELWEKSGEGRGNPSSDGYGYAAYWNSRIAAFRAALSHRAAELLAPDQLKMLAKERERTKAD